MTTQGQDYSYFCNAPMAPQRIPIAAIANFWMQAGGSPNDTLMATAISWYESEQGNLYALSSACAVGLWQIWFGHALAVGRNPADLYDPEVNASFAVTLRYQRGSWADWDSMYNNAADMANRPPIWTPQPGSGVALTLPEVAAQLGVTGGGGGQPVQNPPGQTTPPPQQVTQQPFNGAPAFFFSNTNLSGFENVKQFLGQDQVDYNNFLSGQYLLLQQAMRG